MKDILCFFNDSELSYRTNICYDFSRMIEIYDGDYDYVIDIDTKSIIGVALNNNLIYRTSINNQRLLSVSLNNNKNIFNWDGYHICFCKYARYPSSVYIEIRQIIGVRIYLNPIHEGYIIKIPVWDEDIMELIL